MISSTTTEKLRKLGGDSLVRRMVRLYLATSEADMHRMSAALSGNVLSVVEAAAHHLVSSAGQLGLDEVSELAARVETAARTGDLADAKGAYELLGPALEGSRSGLAAMLRDLPKPPCVAVVDDSEDVRVLVRLILERQFDIVEYATGTAALDGLRRFPPDLIIIDLSLPDMTGVDLLRLLRAEPALRRTPAVALTALSSPGEGTFSDIGFALHVRKPIVDPDELVRSLEELIAN